MTTYKIVKRNKLNETVTLLSSDGEYIVMNEGVFRDAMRKVRDVAVEYFKKGRDIFVKIGNEIRSWLGTPYYVKANHSDTTFASDSVLEKLDELGEHADNNKFMEGLDNDPDAVKKRIGIAAFGFFNNYFKNMSVTAKSQLSSVDNNSVKPRFSRPMSEATIYNRDSFVAQYGGSDEKQSKAFADFYSQVDQRTNRENYMGSFDRLRLPKESLEMIANYNNENEFAIQLESDTCPANVTSEIMKKKVKYLLTKLFNGTLEERNRALLFWGAPGVGKTTIINDVIRQVAESYGKRNMEDYDEEHGGKSYVNVNSDNNDLFIYRLDLSTMSADSMIQPALISRGQKNLANYSDDERKGGMVDPFVGIEGDVLIKQVPVIGALPLFEGGKSMPGYHIVIMDELSRALDSVIFAMLTNLIFTKTTGTLTMPKNTIFIAMSNRVQDHEMAGDSEKTFAKQAQTLYAGANAGRFDSCNYLPKFSEWIDWAKKVKVVKGVAQKDSYGNDRFNIHPCVQFILTQPETTWMWFDSYSERDMDAKGKNVIKLNPREWEFISDAMYDAEKMNDELRAITNVYERFYELVRVSGETAQINPDSFSKIPSIGREAIEEKLYLLKSLPDTFTYDLWSMFRTDFAKKYSSIKVKVPKKDANGVLMYDDSRNIVFEDKVTDYNGVFVGAVTNEMLFNLVNPGDDMDAALKTYDGVQKFLYNISFMYGNEKSNSGYRSAFTLTIDKTTGEFGITMDKNVSFPGMGLFKSFVIYVVERLGLDEETLFDCFRMI